MERRRDELIAQIERIIAGGSKITSNVPPPHLISRTSSLLTSRGCAIIGVFELIGYLALATKSRRPRDDEDAMMHFVLPETRDRKAQEVEFPQIYFVR